MKKILLLFMLISFIDMVNAQSWAPIGAKWTFSVGYAFPPSYIDYNEWVSVKDTLVEGHLCRLIKRNRSGIDGDTDKLITYEDNNRVYWYNINQFATLYDFNKNAGESWTIMNDTCEMVIRVDSTGMDTINGFPLKSLYVSSSSPFMTHEFNGKILQHIGHTQKPTPYPVLYCDVVIMDGSTYQGLRCYEDSILGFHNFGVTSDCNYTTTSISEVESSYMISLHPNPTTNHFTITTPHNLTGNTLTIYNTIGQQVATHTIPPNHTIPLHQLPKGIYYIQTNHLTTPIKTKLIIQ